MDDQIVGADGLVPIMNDAFGSVGSDQSDVADEEFVVLDEPPRIEVLSLVPLILR